MLQFCLFFKGALPFTQLSLKEKTRAKKLTFPHPNGTADLFQETLGSRAVSSGGTLKPQDLAALLELSLGRNRKCSQRKIKGVPSQTHLAPIPGPQPGARRRMSLEARHRADQGSREGTLGSGQALHLLTRPQNSPLRCFFCAFHHARTRTHHLKSI